VAVTRVAADRAKIGAEPSAQGGIVRPFRLAAAAFFAFSAAGLAQFEGVAQFKGSVHTDKGQTIPSQGKVFVTRAACRVEWETDLKQLAGDRKDPKGMMPDHFRLVILQLLSEPGRTYTLNPERKTYSVRDASKDKPDAKVPDRTWKVQKLGRDTVGGLSCEKALVTSDAGNEMEVCVSKELIPSGAWVAAMSRREDQAGPLKALKENGLEGFPIRWIFRSQKSKAISSTMELVSFEKKSLSASLFEIPADYKKTEGSSPFMSAEQEKTINDARKAAMEHMTPEQRKQLEEYMKQQSTDPQP
jgi:hypothetical protein